MVSVNPLFTVLVSLQIKIMELYSKIFKNKAKVVQPLIPESYKHLISPYNVAPESNIEVMRIKEMIIN